MFRPYTALGRAHRIRRERWRLNLWFPWQWAVSERLWR